MLAVPADGGRLRRVGGCVPALCSRSSFLHRAATTCSRRPHFVLQVLAARESASSDYYRHFLDQLSSTVR